MRRAKKERRFVPFTAGIASGYLISLLFAAAGAVLILLTDSAESFSGVMAMITLAAGSFISGRTAGSLRRRSGLKTGALCGIMYLLPLVLLSLIFGTMTGALLLIKIVLCFAFGAAGGVFGVNSSDT